MWTQIIHHTIRDVKKNLGVGDTLKHVTTDLDILVGGATIHYKMILLIGGVRARGKAGDAWQGR